MNNKVHIEGECDINHLLKTFKGWLHFENETDITIPFASVISNFTKTDPGVFGIIAPSGSYKTEFIRSLGLKENKYVFPIDNLTSHTFVSGLRDVEDVIPQLKRKLITIKDFTSILSKREDERSVIFSDIREMTDGYLSWFFGSGKQVNYTDIHSSILFGATSAIENYYSLQSTLGQRIVFFKPNNNPTRVREKAYENLNRKEEMRKELHNVSIKFLNNIHNNQGEQLKNIGDGIDQGTQKFLGDFTDLVALARTHIPKDRKGEISGVPEPEFPTRLYSEIIKLTSCHAIAYEREISNEDIQVGLLVLLSNIPKDKLILINKLAENPGGYDTSELSSRLSISSSIVKKRLNELLMLNIVDRELKAGRTGDSWRLNEKYVELISDVNSFVLGGNPHRGAYVHKDISENKNIIDSTYTSTEIPPTQNVYDRSGKDVDPRASDEEFQIRQTKEAEERMQLELN